MVHDPYQIPPQNQHGQSEEAAGMPARFISINATKGTLAMPSNGAII
jgi:hypothetical protein